ncbi:PREDICTED: transcription factor bHLH93-like [Lupinus angustifolius]|uniref:transcription factor bHLH93-like n=1 Tax=Lupinus angustifolius TaxID=3871 RepID=UPI00092E24DE|nr:PREDICTED: transcription factor bHLH93-like [Lupinus angustifolius]
MELYDHDFLEELMALRRETWDTIPNTEENQLFSNSYSFDQNSLPFLPNNTSCGQEFPQSYNNDYNTFSEIYGSLLDEPSYYNTFHIPHNTPPFLAQEDFPLSLMEEVDNTCLLGEELQNLELQTTCKMDPTQSPEKPVLNMETSLDRNNRAKKLQGQPSKNLMAERRRRKRLNDRLSMLRSIVPKISKMDRTSIVGDTIDYMKELLDKINNLQQEIDVDANMAGIFKDVKPNEIFIRNSPKFKVERNLDTKVEICCAGKPSLLLSTVKTLEALGLEIQQCAISCFNDFSMQASCTEKLEQRTMLSSEDIKQVLFRSAGYGGKCL